MVDIACASGGLMLGVRRVAVVAAGSVAFVFAGGSSTLPTLGGPGPGQSDSAAAGVGWAVAGEDAALTPPADPGRCGGREPELSGEGLVRAEEAALAVTGGGRVTETEIGDEDSRYDVEVTLEDGGRVDIALDAAFQVVSHSVDGDAVAD